MTDQPINLSVVIPCLNEADTLAKCINKAYVAMQNASIVGEIIVADNGSTDRSQEIAQSLGARVIEVAQRGYGAALMHGIEAARGKFVLMGDADDSYDFSEIPAFYSKILTGADLVQGCRLPRGGGRVLPGAMPFLHRYLGNPLLSMLVRIMFRIPIDDVYCGMRAFTKQHYTSLDLRSPGMEFATEMIIKSGIQKADMAQVPITLHPDGRVAHGPHLRTFRDGWRTLRLFLVYSPRWTFFYPGLLLIAISVVGYLLAIPQVNLSGVILDVHTLLVASLIGILGWQCVLSAIVARLFSTREKIRPPHPQLSRLSIEQGIGFGLLVTLIGIAFIFIVVYQWWQIDFGGLDYPATMRWVVPGVTLVAVGFQTIMAALLAGILQMNPSKFRS